MTTIQRGTVKNNEDPMKILAILILATIFLSTTAMAADTGDLQVRSVEYAATSNRLVATIYNQAPAGVSGPILVYFYDNEQKIGEVTYNEDIPRYSIVSVYINYALSEGRHTFKAVADPMNTAQETIESNNDKSVDVIYTSNDSAVVIAPSKKAAAPAADEKGPGSLGFYAGGILLIAAIIAMLLLKMRARGPKREKPGEEKRQASEEKHGAFGAENKPETNEKAAEAERPVRDGLKVKDIIGMPKGTKVKFSARLSYHDKIGNDHAYFLKDETDEIVGFSKEEIRKTQGIVSGAVDRFLGDNTSVIIEKVE